MLPEPPPPLRRDASFCLIETFPTLEKYHHCRAAFFTKQPHENVFRERDAAIQAQQNGHMQALKKLGLEHLPIAQAEQVHGNQIAIVNSKLSSGPYPGTDALITNLRGITLKVFVADCAAVYLVDRYGRAIGLIHSGRKGTELEIVPATIRALEKTFQILPSDLIVQIGPCIRPPHYEVNFAAAIVDQALSAGATEINDCGICTACHPARYYSYRMEKGKTGRMAAVLALI